MSPLPIVCGMSGCHVLFLAFVEPEFTMDQVADTISQAFVGRTIPAQPGRVLRIKLQDSDDILARDALVSDQGWRPREAVNVVYE